MKKIVIILLIICILTPSIFAAKLTVSWNASCDTNVVGHWVKWGWIGTTIRTNIRPAYVDDCGRFQETKTNLYRGIYTNAVFIPGYTNNTYVANNLLNNMAYAFVVTRTNNAGDESDLSIEVIGVVPPETNGLPSAVQQFKITKVEK